MILKYLLVLLLGVNLSWSAPQEVSTKQKNTNETRGDFDLSFRNDYKYEPVTEMYYKIHTSLKTWSGAIAACKVEEAELATPFTKIEAEIIQKHVSGVTSRIWLGIHDLYSQGIYVTLNGTWASDIYTDGPLRKGNNFQVVVNCITMSKLGKYDVVPCNGIKSFVCTKHRSEVTRNHDCETTSKGYLLESKASRCYKIHTTPMTWREAYSTCESEEAALAVVNSQEEADLFLKYFAKYPENTLKGNFIKDVILLDFTDIISRGQFLTSKGKTLKESGYSRLRGGRLDNEEHCGSMRKDGRLDYIGCKDRALFICEKALKHSTQLTDSRFDGKVTVKAPQEKSSDSDLSYRKDYTYEQETETYYKQHDTEKEWSDAIATCKVEGAKLAEPFTQIEIDMILKYFIVPSDNERGIWLGIHDLFIEGKLITLNGTRASDTILKNVTTSSDFYHYGYGEKGNRNCLYVNYKRIYRVAPCTRKYKFVCTKHRSEIIQHHECETTSNDYFLESEAGRCYKIHTTPKNWREAYTTCDNEKATLAMANSQAEADLFIKYFAKYPEGTLKGNFKDVIFLDFTDIVIRREFFTSNGKTLEESGYSAWWNDQPDDLHDEEHCGSMRRDGKLTYLRCEEEALFICEKTLKHSTQLMDAKFGDKGTVKVLQEMLLTHKKINETSDESDLSFRKGYTYEAETEIFYKEHSTLKTWSDAVATCKSEGAELAMPVSKIEAEIVQKHFNDRSYYTWLGIHDLFNEGQFITLNGMSATNVYTDWEPNDKYDHCVGMTNEGKYRDVSCRDKYPFICTKRQSEITRNHECETIYKDYIFEGKTGHCYKIHTTPKTWREAYRICYNEETSLAMANSQAEADLFIKYLAKHPENTLNGNFIKEVIFLNFNDIITRREFVTNNGKALEVSGYSAWREGQPDNLDDEEHCGSMHRDGKLDYLKCKDRALFMCEKAVKQS